MTTREAPNIVAQLQESKTIGGFQHIKVKVQTVDKKNQLVPFQEITAIFGKERKTIKIGASGETIVDLNFDLRNTTRNELQLCLNRDSKKMVLLEIEPYADNFWIVKLYNTIRQFVFTIAEHNDERSFGIELTEELINTVMSDAKAKDRDDIVNFYKNPEDLYWSWEDLLSDEELESLELISSNFKQLKASLAKLLSSGQIESLKKTKMVSRFIADIGAIIKKISNKDFPIDFDFQIKKKGVSENKTRVLKKGEYKFVMDKSYSSIFSLIINNIIWLNDLWQTLEDREKSDIEDLTRLGFFQKIAVNLESGAKLTSAIPKAINSCNQKEAIDLYRRLYPEVGIVSKEGIINFELNRCNKIGYRADILSEIQEILTTLKQSLLKERSTLRSKINAIFQQNPEIYEMLSSLSD